MQWLWRFDQDAFRAIHVGLHRDWLDPVFWIVSSSGLGWVQACVVLLLPLLLSRRFREWRQPSLRETFRTLFRASVTSWRDPLYLVGPMLFVIVLSGTILSGLAKRSIERERPSNFVFAHPQESFYFGSFPSGHTTTSFAIGFMLLFVTWKTPRWWVGVLGISWASLVGFSRIYRGVHWPTDVLAGACCGLVAACVTYLLMRKIAEAGRVDDTAPDL